MDICIALTKNIIFIYLNLYNYCILNINGPINFYIVNILFYCFNYNI